MKARITRCAGQWAVAACLLIAFAGCHKKQAVDETGSGAVRHYKIAGIIFQQDQFFRLVTFGMQDSAAKAGVELLTADSNNKLDREIQLIDAYTAGKVDAIVISPLDQKASMAALKRAHDNGIAIITYNTPVDGDFASTFIECSSRDLGRQTGQAAAKYIQEYLGGKAKIAIVAFKSLAAAQSDGRTGGFKEEIAKLPGVQIVAEQDAWLAEAAVKRVGDILTANPDVDIVYGANEGGTVGAVLAVKNAGKAGRVAVFGTDCSQQLLGMLQSPDNILQAITSQRPVNVGQMAVESAIQTIEGKSVEKLISLKGVLLSRDNPDGVRHFATQFAQWTAQGN